MQVELTCSRCFGQLDLPLYCKECQKWFCGRCWNLHDWEAMPMPPIPGSRTGLE